MDFKIRDESAYSFQRELILGLIAERKKDIKARSAMRSERNAAIREKHGRAL